MPNSSDLLGRNINLVKSHNIRTILLSLLKEGPACRVELVQKLALSNTTITNLAAELLDQGILLEKHVEASEKRSRVERPRRMLGLAGKSGFVIGVRLFRGAVTDLFTEILCSEIKLFGLTTPPVEVIREILQRIRGILETCDIERERVIGVGERLPG